MRIDPFTFIRQLLLPQGQIIGLLDSRTTGINAPPVDQQAYRDPSMFVAEAPLTDLINLYVRRELSLSTSLEYVSLSRSVKRSRRWSEPSSQGYPNESDALREAMSRNKNLRVFAAMGYYDLTTPFWSQQYGFEHLSSDSTFIRRIVDKGLSGGPPDLHPGPFIETTFRRRTGIRGRQKPIMTQGGAQMRFATSLVFFAMAFTSCGKPASDEGTKATVPVFSKDTATATFAGGCFWCMEPPFEKLHGVIKVLAGYTGGTKPNPKYQEVGAGGTGYMESIQVTYDPGKISYLQLLNAFWRSNDPTDRGRPVR